MPRPTRPAPRDLVAGDWPSGRPIREGTGIELLQSCVQRILRACNGMSARAISERTGLHKDTIDTVLITGTSWPDWYTWTQLEIAFGVLSPVESREPGKAFLAHFPGLVPEGANPAAIAHKGPLVRALAEALGGRCELNRMPPLNQIFHGVAEDYNPARHLNIDLYDPERKLIVCHTGVVTPIDADGTFRFKEVFTSLGILDAISLQFSERQSRALLLPMKPPPYVEVLASSRGTNVIYPAGISDHSSFQDAWGAIFVDGPNSPL